MQERKIESPRLAAELIAGKITGKDRIDLYLEPRITLTEDEYVEFRKKIKERGRGVPLAYITGESYFMGYRFLTPPGVYIPRPETEILVEKALQILEKLTKRCSHRLKVIDIGTGTGNIAISIAKQMWKVYVYAVDISSFALKVAGTNARIHGVNHKIKFLSGDIFAPLSQQDLKGKTDLIISNPPYVYTGMIRFLPREVRKEPVIALDGGKDGLNFYRKIVSESVFWLKEGGYLLLEIGYNQTEGTRKIIQEHRKSWSNPEIISDLNKNPRLLIVQKVSEDGY